MFRAPLGGGAVTKVLDNGSSEIDMDEDHVYFTGSDVYRKPKSLGDATTLTTSATSAPIQVQVHGSRVYWLDGVYSQIRSISKTGGTPETHITLTDRKIKSFAVSDNYIHYIDLASFGNANSRAIRRYDLSTKKTHSMHNNDPSLDNADHMVADSKAFYWADTDGIEKSPFIPWKFTAEY